MYHMETLTLYGLNDDARQFYLAVSNPNYCCIIRVRGGSILVVFVGSPPPRPRIYIFKKNPNFERVSYIIETENRRIFEITSQQMSK